MVCNPVSNITCTIKSSSTIQIVTLTNASNIIFQVTNLSNPFGSSYFNFQIYSNNYLMSYNNNSLKYIAPC